MQNTSNMNLDKQILEADKMDFFSGNWKEVNDMASKLRQRVDIGDETKWVAGSNMQQIIFQAAKLMVEAGMFSTPNEKKSATPLFAVYAMHWFNTYKAKSLSVLTAKNYLTDLNKHLIPHFGEMQIGDIRTSDIQVFYDSKKEYAHSTVRTMGILLYGIFQSAIEDEWIQTNPAKSKRLTMSTKKTERKALTSEKVSNIASSIHKLRPLDGVFLALLLYTGVRRGEALGLKWEDIDWDEKLIHIKRAVKFSGNRPIVGDPKSSAGIRVIPLHPALEQILTDIFDGSSQADYITTQCDNPMTQIKYRRTWERIEKTIELYGATPHIFRHTYITLAASATDIKTLQCIAGHADITTTMNRYAHGRIDKIKEAGTNMNGLFNTIR